VTPCPGTRTKRGLEGPLQVGGVVASKQAGLDWFVVIKGSRDPAARIRDWGYGHVFSGARSQLLVVRVVACPLIKGCSRASPIRVGACLPISQPQPMVFLRPGSPSSGRAPRPIFTRRFHGGVPALVAPASYYRLQATLRLAMAAGGRRGGSSQNSTPSITASTGRPTFLPRFVTV